MEEYFDKLELERFPAINNQNLTKIDLHRYDEACETDPKEAISSFFELDDMTLKSRTVVADLRRPVEFQGWHPPNAINVPLDSLGPTIPSPFFDPAVLEAQWIALEGFFKLDTTKQQLSGKRVLLVCYNGDTARVATSVLRAKGIEAESIRGESIAFKRSFPALLPTTPSCYSRTALVGKAPAVVAVEQVVE